MAKFFLLFLCFNIITLQAVDLSITQSGTYKLGRNLLGAPSNNDFVVQISANQVTLDLDGYTIQQNNANTNVNLIEIDAGVQEITIKNGRLLGSSGTNIAISIGDGAQQVTIDNMLIESCTSAVTGANNNRLIFMQDIVVNNFSRAASISLFSFTSTTQIYAQDITITNNTTTGANNLFCFNLSQVSNSIFKNITVDSNTAGSSLQVVSLTGSSGTANLTRNIFDSFIIRFNQYATTFNAFNLLHCSNNIINNCDIINNAVLNGSGSASTFIIYLQQTNTTIPTASNIITNNRLINNGAQGDLFGIYFVGASVANANMLNNLAEGNIVLGHTPSPVANFAGIYANRSVGSILNNNLVANNIVAAGGGISLGLEFRDSTNCTAQNNLLIRNILTGSPANSFGIFLAGTFTPYFISQNIGFNNGTTLANQMFNVAPGSQQNGASPESQNLNSVTSPWTNVPAAT